MLLNSTSKLLFLPLGLLGATGKCTICRRSDFVCRTRCNCFGGLVFVRGMKAIREVCGKSKWKFKMAFAMKGGGVSRGSRVPHIYFEI